MNNYNEDKIKNTDKVIEKTFSENVAVKKVEKIEIVEKESKILYIIIGIIISIGILFLLFYIGKGILDKKNTVKELINQEQKSKIIMNGNICFDLENYYLITRGEINDSGEDILVKYKIEGKKFDCEYVVEEGDFELKNVKIDNSKIINFNQYYLYLTDNKLIINQGIGNNQKLQIYNLDTRENIFTDNFNLNIEDLSLNKNILTYWRTTNDIPNHENCSKVDEYNKIGGAKIEAKIILDINDVSKKEFSEFKCSSVE